MRPGEAHMLRIKRRKSRRRPYGPPPVFLADCVRLDATEVLAKSRGAQLTEEQRGSAGDFSSEWTLQWTEDGRPRCRTIVLQVTATRQHLGGVRRWWRCPMCGRRCRILVAVSQDAPIGYRLCLHARYVTNHPARDRRRRFVALVHALGSEALDTDDKGELDWLLARRRRGVRRGRRVAQRAARALARFNRRCSADADILRRGGF